MWNLNYQVFGFSFELANDAKEALYKVAGEQRALQLLNLLKQGDVIFEAKHAEVIAFARPF